MKKQKVLVQESDSNFDSKTIPGRSKGKRS